MNDQSDGSEPGSGIGYPKYLTPFVLARKANWGGGESYYIIFNLYP